MRVLRPPFFKVFTKKCLELRILPLSLSEVFVLPTTQDCLLKDPQAVPLKGDLEEGRACLPGSVEDRGLTSTPATGGHSSGALCTDPPLIVSLL